MHAEQSDPMEPCRMLHRIARRITAIIGRLSSHALLIAGFMILVMVFTATYGVVRRYVFNSPEPYSYEISMMFLLFSFVFAISAVERLGQQLRVDIISNRMPKKVQQFVLGILTPCMGIAFVSILAYKGVEAARYALDIGERSASAWKQPMGPIKLMIPIGYCILLLVLLVKLVSGVTRFCALLAGKDAPLDAFAPGDAKQGDE